MSTTILIQDTKATGEVLGTIEIVLSSERVTLRDLIRQRVCKEVSSYNNTAISERYSGLVELPLVEKILNAQAQPKEHKRKYIDPEKQYLKALAAFESNGYFVTVNDKQIQTLDEAITLEPSSVVHFIKLIPLIGG